ncbi:hypothetical protein N566_20025 [Streptomycetaceae bacterium MP113-05]|nr:hypothetical protein N566_20025 [Streptomycetaceae bacterium MP113-05]
MSASSPHGFVVVRRGYRPDQVDGRVSDLTEERDGADERAARLTLLAKELTEEAERLHHLVTTLPPQTYETLGARAREILATVEAEAAEIRSDAEAEAQRSTEHAEDIATAAEQAARDHAARTRSTAETAAGRILDTAHTTADEIRTAARATTDEVRSEASDALEEMTRRCHSLLADQRKEHTAESDALHGELGEAETETEARLAALDDHSRSVLADAERAHAHTEEDARHRQEDADARAADILAAAHADRDRLERETARVLRDHEEQADELRAHMTHVRSSLATLTGRDDTAEAGTVTATEPDDTRPREEPEPDAQLPEQTNRSAD